LEEFLSEIDRPRLAAFLADLQPTGGEVELTLESSEGTAIFCRFSARRAVDPSCGELIALAVTDLTDRISAFESGRKLATLAEATDDAVLAWDLEGRIVSWNGGAFRSYGYAVEEMIGRPIRLLI